MGRGACICGLNCGLIHRRRGRRIRRLDRWHHQLVLDDTVPHPLWTRETPHLIEATPTLMEGNFANFLLVDPTFLDAVGVPEAERGVYLEGAEGPGGDRKGRAGRASGCRCPTTLSAKFRVTRARYVQLQAATLRYPSDTFTLA